MKYIVLGPGGIFFYTLIGHLYRISLDGKLDDMEEISGASAGALVAFTWSLGKSSIFDYMFTQDLEFKMNPMSLLKKKGLVDSKKFREKLVHLCVSVFGFEDITFKEHYEKTSIKLHVSAFSLYKRNNVYFSVDTSPDMSVIDAVTMSCAIPIYFTPFKDHIDGGFMEGVPTTPFLGKDDVYVITMDKTYPNEYTKSFGQYVYLLCSVIMNNRFSNPNFTTKYLETPGDINPVSFNIPKIDRFKLFSSGFSSKPIYHDADS